MAILSRPHKLLFIMTPRTGCSAIGQALVNSLDGEYLPAEDVLDDRGRFRVQRKHCTLGQLLEHGLLTNEERRSLFVVAAVRNPFDSLVSLYSKLTGKYQPNLQNPDSWVFKVNGYVEEMEYCRSHSFPEWVEWRYGTSFRDRLLGRGRRTLNSRFADGADFIMRFERLQQDFDQALAQIRVEPPIEVPVINTTPGRERDYRRYYTPRARRTVEYALGPELARFGYEF
jgi:hypothetical protein